MDDPDLYRLEAWHAEYAAIKPRKFDPDSAVWKEVTLDGTDPNHIESQIVLKAATLSISDRFCNHCTYLFNHWPDLPATVEQQWTYAVGRLFDSASLQAAARLGCVACIFLVQRLHDTNLLEIFQKVERRLERLGLPAAGSIIIQNWSDNDNMQFLSLHLPGKECDPECFLPWTHELTQFQSCAILPSSYSDVYKGRIDIASEWLRSCPADHQLCATTQSLERPTRLLCIESASIRLVLTKDWEQMPPYATLSYCWGTGASLKLTTDTFSAFCRQIDWQVLPRTMREAVTLARQLGLDYIWIDALCIMQDIERNDDWLKEYGRMRSIYGGSFINLAASSATHVHDDAAFMPSGFHGGFLARVHRQDSCRVHAFYAWDVYERATSRSHLGSRAWTLQERLLAPRTIYFGQRGLLWECRTELASEFLTTDFPAQHLLGTRLVSADTDGWYWADIVVQYSRMHLTNKSDKLPALSGMARRQCELTGDTYLVGMWKERLVEQLGWKALAKSPKTRERAPTWSWISHDGPVAYQYDWSKKRSSKTEFVTILEASTTLAGTDPYGAITSAQLRLACNLLIRGSVTQRAGAEVFHVLEHNIQDEDILNFPITMDGNEDESSRSETYSYVLPLFDGESGGSIGSDWSSMQPLIRVQGIVLRKCGTERGHFERVGAFSYKSSDDREYFYSIMRMIEKVGGATAESECAYVSSSSDDGQSRYVIEIV